MSAAAAGADRFRGTARKAAKLSLANAPLENFFANKKAGFIAYAKKDDKAKDKPAEKLPNGFMPDPAFPKGPIQLQTHGSEIRWRNVFIREIPAEEANKELAARDADGFVEHVNGKDLSNWQGAVVVVVPLVAAGWVSVTTARMTPRTPEMPALEKALAEGNVERARSEFEALALDLDAPRGVQARVQQALATLPARKIDLDAPAAPAPAAPAPAAPATAPAPATPAPAQAPQ